MAKRSSTPVRARVTRSARKTPRGRRPPAAKRVAPEPGGLTVTEVDELDTLRRELERVSRGGPVRWNANPEDARRSVAHLVLTLVEFIRKLLERQAIRRMESGTLSAGETEDVGRALMTLEQTVRDIAVQFGIPPEDLNLDLGPIGKLM